MKSQRPSAHARFVIDDPSKVGEVRRAAQQLASYELGSEVAARVAIVTNELANNLERHAGGGEVLLQAMGADGNTFVELLSIDKGPGMADVQRCMTDGYSTGGTQGTGLGAVRRLATDFDIHSTPGEGTVIMARFGATPTLRYGAVNVAIEGEVECGDAWQVEHDDGVTAVMICDGLGHGSFAAEAARAGIGAFLSAPFNEPADTMTRANAAMSKTRGGAGASARVAGDRVSYSGVGNIAGYLVSPERSQGLVSHNGTLGINQRRAQQFEYRAERGALLVMHSDGVSTRWNLKDRPDLLHCHPSVIAAAIYRDHGRGRDDSTIVVVKL